MRLKYKNILHIFIYLFLVMFVWIGFGFLPKPDSVDMNSHSESIIDLTDFNFESSVVYLNSSSLAYDTYIEELYSPDDFLNGKVSDPVKVSNEDYLTYDYMTHRLKLMLPDVQVYGITMRSCEYSMRIFINGEEIDCVGLPGETKESSVPKTDVRDYFFSPINGCVEIIIQTSNFVQKEGCKLPTLRLGTASQISKIIRNNMMIPCIMIGCLLLAGLYHIALYIINQRNKSLFVLSFACFILMLLALRSTPMVFNSLSWYWTYRLEHMEHYMIFITLFTLIILLYKELINKYVAVFYYALTIVFAAFQFVFSPEISSDLLVKYDFISVFVIIYIIIKLFISLKNGKMQNLLSFFGILFLLIFGLSDMIFLNQMFNLPTMEIHENLFTTPLGMVFFMACYAMVLSLDMSEKEQNIVQTAILLQETEEQLKKIYEDSLQDNGKSNVMKNLDNFGLSPREKDVALLLLDGKSREEICGILNISRGTVNTHCMRIYKKTGATGVHELFKILGFNSLMQ